LLLDTHTLLWWLADDPRLRGEVRDHVADSEDVFVSTASAWEISLKRALGKLVAPTTCPRS
jgi:PIN domain nuclease of toxin-antitoxin system